MLFFFHTSREMIHLISCIFHFLHRDLRNCDSNQHDVFHKTSQSMRATNCVRTATSRRPLRHKMQEYFLVRWGTSCDVGFGAGVAADAMWLAQVAFSFLGSPALGPGHKSKNPAPLFLTSFFFFYFHIQAGLVWLGPTIFSLEHSRGRLDDTSTTSTKKNFACMKY